MSTIAVTFKLAFTSEDSPELMAGLAVSIADKNLDVSLVSRARIVFISIGLALAYTIAFGFSHKKKPNRKLYLVIDSHLLTHI